MYLTQAAISQTLAEIGGFAPGTQLITDYMLPPGLRDEAGADYAGLVAPAAAERGEPWLTFLAPGDMTALLEGTGSASSSTFTSATRSRPRSGTAPTPSAPPPCPSWPAPP